MVAATGDRIAYVAHPNPRRLARLVVRRTSNGSIVRSRNLQDPDTDLLAFRDGRVWLSQGTAFAGSWNVATGTVRKFRKGHGTVVAVDPTAGRAVRTSVDRSRTQVITLDRRPRVLWRVPESFVVGWSPDDRYLLTYSEDCCDEGTVTEIAARDARTGRLVRRVRHDWLGWPPRIVWSGSRSFLAARGGYRPSELMRYGLGGGSEVLAEYRTRYPEWIPWLPAVWRP